MKRMSIIAAAVVLLGVLAGCQDRQQQAAPPAVSPVPFITSDQIRHLEEAAKSAPKNPAGWIALGNALFDMNQCFQRLGPQQVAGCIDAASAYQKALALEPKNVNVLVDRGTALWASGKFEEALAEHRKALKLDPRHLNAHLNSGVVLTDMNRPKEAVKEFEIYLKLAPNAPNADRIRQWIAELKART